MLGCLALCALAACGGGGSSDPAAPDSPPAQACKTTVRVQLYGDSTQWLAFEDGSLQRWLDTRFGAGRVVLELQAVPGTTSQDLIDGTDGLNLPWAGDLSADIAIENFGINDASHHLSLEDYSRNLRSLMAGNGVTRMVLETPNPTDPARHTQNGDYAAAGRAVAADMGVPLADVQAYAVSRPDWLSLLNADGVHPSPEGQAAIARNVTGPVLARVIAPMLCK